MPKASTKANSRAKKRGRFSKPLPPLTSEQQELAAQFVEMTAWACRSRFASIVSMIQGGLDEAISIAQVAVCEAARHFDASTGFTFGTYAMSYIKGYLLTAASGREDLIRVKSGGLQEERIWLRSLDTPRKTVKSGDERPPLGEVLPDRKHHDPDFEPDEAAVLRKALTFLSPTQRRVIELRTSTPLTLEEVGKEVGVTRERVRQIEMDALEKLRKLLVLDGDGLRFFPTLNIEADR